MASLRRWEPLLAAFAHIDATIEAAAGAGSRAAFRRERDRIVAALRAADDDASAAEEIGALLDAAMAESLVTLRDAVPASAAKAALASGEVVAALGALGRHGCASARVRELARDVVRSWRAGVEAEVATARAALAVLDGLAARKRDGEAVPVEKQLQADLKKKPAKKEYEIFLEEEKKRIVVGRFDKKSVPRKTDRELGCVRVKESACVQASTEVAAPPPKKATSGGAPGNKKIMMLPPTTSRSQEKNIVGTKRKLHDRYEEAEDAKRCRTVRVIEAPAQPHKTRSPMKKQGRTTQQAVTVAARDRAPCAGERRPFVSSLRRV